jgi:hypothetical protein
LTGAALEQLHGRSCRGRAVACALFSYERFLERDLDP